MQQDKLQPPKNPLYFVIDNVRSLANVGAFFRLGDALNITRLYLCGITPYPLSEGDLRRYGPALKADEAIKKVALEGYRTVSWEYREKTTDVIQELKKQGVQIIALEQTEKSIDYTQATYKLPTAIVVGHETEGVSKEVIQLADQTVEIPMYGKGKSLNVAMSLAILGYEVARKTISTPPNKH